MRTWTMWIAAVGLAAILGCEREQPTASAPAPAAQSAALPQGLLVNQPPPEARPIAQVLAEARDGESVVTVGRVGGRKDPFVADRAVVLVVDKSLRSCLDEGDECATAWDYCCVPREQIAANSASVQVSDADGKPLRLGLQGAGGLKPLSEVIVQGTVRRPGDGKAVTIEAAQLHVVQGASK